jgi:hypothetical protein
MSDVDETQGRSSGVLCAFGSAVQRLSMRIAPVEIMSQHVSFARSTQRAGEVWFAVLVLCCK